MVLHGITWYYMVLHPLQLNMTPETETIPNCLFLSFSIVGSSGHPDEAIRLVRPPRWDKDQISSFQFSFVDGHVGLHHVQIFWKDRIQVAEILGMQQRNLILTH